MTSLQSELKVSWGNSRSRQSKSFASSSRPMQSTSTEPTPSTSDTPTSFVWGDLTWWETGECQVIEERLADLTKRKIAWNPGKKNLYRAMKETPFDKVKVVIIGQDPYPNPKHATGLAFSIPKEETDLPPTLQNILAEYHSDLGYQLPTHGCLDKWAHEGVFLWNTIPTCTAFNSMSHGDWVEYELLTEEIFRKLSDKGVVFACLGAKAQKYIKYVDQDDNYVVITAHPSPRAALNKKLTSPFRGSRLFTTINIRLKQMGIEQVDWRL